MDSTEQLGLDLMTETGKKSRGGLSDYSDLKKESVQRVRGDFLSPIFKPKITFAIDSVTFNMSCVNLFPEHQHIVINIDEANQRIIIEPSQDYDRDSLKFATFNLKKEKNNPRKCMARIFCSMVYDMMGWNRAAKYRCMAVYQELGNKRVIVFNLDECLQVFTEVIESAGGKKKRNTIINMPEDWKGRFGYTLEELDTKYKVDTASTFITIDHKTGERHNAQISAKLPTPEELMHRPYGGIRMNAEDGDENE
jgi:hypothetical protein